QLHRFGDRDPRQQLRALQLHAGAQGQFMLVIDRMTIQDGDSARGRRIQPLDAVQQGRLARPVGADESEDVPLPHLKETSSTAATSPNRRVTPLHVTTLMTVHPPHWCPAAFLRPALLVVPLTEEAWPRR